MLTPVTSEGEPNPEMIERIVNVLIDDGVDGLYVLGSTGQGPAFRFEQRQFVAARVVNAAEGRVPVIIHVGTAATQDSVDLAVHAQSVGADGISTVPPIYFPVDADRMFAHYDAIGSATSLPFFPYHHTMFGDAAIANPGYTDRLMEIPNIAGMKITVRDLYLFGLIQQRTQGRLQLFSGADELFCHAAVSGAVGAIGSFYNLWGPKCREIRQAFIGGDFQRGRDFMAVFQAALDKILRSGSPMGFLRAGMRVKYNVEIGAGRSPSARFSKTWDEDEVREILSAVEEA
jgi:N-acetylneuraminate lyase